MKSNVLTTLFMILGSLICMAQTPEEEAAQKMMDSIMESMPANQKAFMQQMMNMGKEAEEKRKKEKERAKKKQDEINEKNAAKSEKEFYWRNKIASNTQGKFQNWTHGKVDIKIRFSKGRNKPADFLKIGEISANGQVTIQLPQLDFRKWPRIPITKPASEGDHMISSSHELTFSNKNVTYFSTRFNLGAYKGEEYLGFLNLGNAIKPVVNLNAPCCFDKAGDGYAAHWVFMSQANTIAGTNGKDGSIVHDLKFQSGWNLVMVRVEGTREKTTSGVSGQRFWKNQYYTATTSLPSDAKYYFHSDQ